MRRLGLKGFCRTLAFACIGLAVNANAGTVSFLLDPTPFEDKDGFVPEFTASDDGVTFTFIALTQ